MTIRFETILLLFGLLIAIAHAHESDSSSLSPHTYRKLDEIQTLITQENYPEAARKLQKLLFSVSEAMRKHTC